MAQIIGQHAGNITGDAGTKYLQTIPSLPHRTFINRNMDYVEILGLAAAVFTTAANIPQTIKVLKTGSTKSLAASTYIMLLAGGILWVIYGIIRDDLPVILANAIAGSLCGLILFIKLLALYKRRKAAMD